MWAVELLVVLAFIWLGARLGSIGVGFAGGFGVLVLSLVFGLKPGEIPIDVILIIMSVIAAIAAMQVAGGLDYLVQLAERILRSNPKHITFLAPLVTYVMTLMAGTGHTAFSTLPVIAEVAKREGVRPSRPLSIATVASQIAITASPISAAVVFFASMLLYSQAATTRALMPAALALGVGPEAAIASFAAVSALFVLPTYPTPLAAMEFDDTGSTRLGKYVFDHPFLIPGVVTIVLAVSFAFLLAPLVVG